MGTRSILLAAVLAATSLVVAAPIDTSATATAIGANQNAELAYRIKAAGIIGNTKAIATSCNGQSCEIANLSGSTGKMPTIKPAGGDATGYKCISKYSPETVKVAEKARPGKAAPSNSPFGSLALGFANVMGMLSYSVLDKGTYTCNCKKNIVIYARGTTEIGLMGEIVGPFLVNNLSPSSDWEVCGVNYFADLAGDYCVGLPGGMVARDMLVQAAQKCPDAKIFLAGYSEGAMVSHNGVAYAPDDAKKRVSGVVAWGDPFQGAPIKGYNGPIMTYCATDDMVCTGNFVIGVTHLAYSAGYTVQQGAKAMMDIAAGKRVVSNRVVWMPKTSDGDQQGQ